MSISAYPLAWPDGWPRSRDRKVGQFGTTKTTHGQAGNSWKSKADLTMADAMKRLHYELERLGIDVTDDSIVSTNLKLNLSGLPRGDQGEPTDPGVAVYFQKKAGPMRVIAIDAYTRVRDNVAAIAATLEAMRAIERHGGAQILERAFSGFAALAAPGKNWWDVLEVKPDASRDAIENTFRRLARDRHPDRGGSNEAMAQLNEAREAALRARPSRFRCDSRSTRSTANSLSAARFIRAWSPPTSSANQWLTFRSTASRRRGKHWSGCRPKSTRSNRGWPYEQASQP